MLHSIFWNNSSPDGGYRPAGDRAAIDEHFGSLDAFAGPLSTAITAVQGSRCGVLAWQTPGHRLIVQQVYDRHGNVGQRPFPILARDAREHADRPHFRNAPPDHVDRPCDLVKRAGVTTRFDADRAAGPAITGPR